MTENKKDLYSESLVIRSAAITSSISRSAGGLFWSVRALCSSLIDNNCLTQVFGLRDEYSTQDQHEWGQVPVSVFNPVGPRAFGYQQGLLRAMRTYQPDIVHVHGLWMYPSVAAMQWSAGKGLYMISPHGMLDPWAIRNSAWKKKVASSLYEATHLKGAACIRALCTSEMESIRAYGLKNPVTLIPNGVDLPDLAVQFPMPAWESRLPVGAKVLFFLSRLHPKKGLLGLIEAWAQARVRCVAGADEWQLVIAGWEQGGHQSELERRACELNIADSVHFVGPQFDAAKAASLRRADAFVLPSFSEGLPMAVLEAWSYELPVLMTPQCNLPEGFAAAAAIRVEPDIESLVEGMAELFCMSDKERHEYGQRGRALVEQKFTWASIGAEMVDMYRWLLGGGASPASVSLV